MKNIFHVIENKISDLADSFCIALENNDLERAIAIESQAINELSKYQANDRFFDSWDSKTTLAKNIAILRNKKKFNIENIERNNHIIFILNNPTNYAHEEQLSEIIQRLKQICPSLKVFVLYIHGTKDSFQNQASFYRYAVDNFIYLENGEILNLDNLKKQFSHVKDLLPSSLYIVITDTALLFRVSLATKDEKLVFFAMRYLPRQLVGIHSYICGGNIGEEIKIHNKIWKCISLPPIKFNEKTSLAQKYTLSSISRIQKINNIEFLETIANLITQTPQSIFKFTSLYISDQNIVDNVKEFFANKNLSSRVNHLGMINPKSQNYWDDLSVYIEPFPFGGGQMLFNAIRKGIPTVYNLGNQAQNSQICIADNYIKYSMGIFYNDFYELSCANNETDFINKAANLFQDKTSRKKYYDLINTLSNEISNENTEKYNLNLKELFFSLL